MRITTWRACAVLALGLALGMSACDDSSSPLSADVAASISGTVVADQTGDPIAGVTVDLEQCSCGEMMRSTEWNQCQSTMTDAQGRFHFEYMHQSMRRYRVTVRGETHSHCMYYIDSRDEKDIELRVP